MSRAKCWLIFLTVVVAFAAPVRGQNLPKVRAAYTSIGIQFDPVYIMKELDLPRKHGLDVEVLFVPVSSRALQAALAGEIQFLTSGGVANINANATGADFVGLTATLNTFAFKILGSPDIKKPENLRGKKVAISRLGGASDFSVRYALTHWGLVPDKDVALLQVGGEPESVLALQNKAVDAAILSEPFSTVATRAGSVLVADLSQLGVPYTMHGFGVRKSFIRANRDVVVRFMKAYLEGIYLFKTNKELALNVLKKYTRLDDLSLVQVSYDEMSQRLIRRVPYPDREGIQTIIDQLAKTRPQMKTLNAGDFIDPSILKEIEDSGFMKKLYGN
ncbi:MAG TPA: NrtA/SsuA/CpmA family ABC transporter substrate-binding protein [Candidatus Limnocylindria bacterium]|nr:NrtA/SsuA/CpmA family ABC transporter substrate-binding protein [Candidatus Limnocylindria bacterium]